MLRKYHLITTILICLLSVSCTKKKVSGLDYIRYIENEDNGLKVSRNIDGIKYSVMYKPVDFVLLKENRNDNLKEKREDLIGMQYYTLSYSLITNDKDILKAKLNSKDEYFERVNYFSFGLQNDVFLVDGKDTLKCKLFNYVRSYGLSPRADFIMAFETKTKKTIEDKRIVIEDKIYGGGIINLKIAKKDIENIPELIEQQL